MTNADKIRAMTDEELEDFLHKIQDDTREDWTPIGCYHCVYHNTHHQPEDCIKENCEYKYGVLNWLKSKS